MVGGLSVGGWTTSVFHLVVHAAFKALLFLAAGSVIRTVGTNLMSEMGGLARRMPLTFAAFISGAAALAGIPPFSGSFSKDAILGAARAAAFDAHPVVPVAHWAGALVYVVGLLTALVTAAYSTRMVVRTFGGRPRHDAVIQEAPWQMSAPVAFLGIAAAVLGVEASHPEFFSWLPPPVAGTGNPRIEAAPYFILGIVLVAVAVGVAQLWRRAPAADPSDVLPAAVRRTFDRAFFVDELYDTIFVRPLFRLATLVRQVDERGVDGVVNATGGATRLAGATLRLAQNGNVQTYATGLFVGVVVIAAAVAVLR
jgi:NADH-quinone oxidoreductase subunit L